MLLDIVRADGAVVRADGSRVRAATNCALGSDGDRMLTVGYFIDSEDAYARQGEVRIARIRAGTRLLSDDGKGLVVPRRACGTRFRILRGRAGRTGGRGTASVLLLWRAAAAGGLHSEEKRLHPRPVARRRRDYGRDGRHSGSTRSAPTGGCSANRHDAGGSVESGTATIAGPVPGQPPGTPRPKVGPAQKIRRNAALDAYRQNERLGQLGANYINLFLANAFPEPDLKYFSSSRAFVSVSTAT
jgi:hypothetical protein